MAVQCDSSKSDKEDNVENLNTIAKQWWHTCSPQYIFLIVLLLLTVVISLTTLTVFLRNYGPKINSEEEEDIATGFSNYSGSASTLNSSLNFISRSGWLGAAPRTPSLPLSLPVPYVVIMHTATDNCFTEASCSVSVHAMQRLHIEGNGWNDIGYSFLVGGNGNIYEGRGWKSVGAFAYGYNSRSIGIALIGNFVSKLPPQRQTDAAKMLVEDGVKMGYISQDYKLLGAMQIRNTLSPGLVLYEDLKKWPHWAEHP